MLPSPSTKLVPASSPRAVLELPVVQKSSASSPMAVLKFPVVLLSMARSPKALFWPPVVLLKSAPRPWALLKNPLSLSRSALTPTALLSSPVVLKKSAAVPTAVFAVPLLKNRVPAPKPLLKRESVLNSENHPKAALKLLPEFSRALYPSAVLLLTGKGDGSGLSGPTAPYASPIQASTDSIVTNIAKLLRFFINLISFCCFGLL